VTGWTVAVRSNAIHIGPRTAGFILKFSSTVSPTKWEAHPGWFVFAESEQRVWVFDGDREVLLLESTPERSHLVGSPLKHYPVPAAVAERLPESLRKEIPPP